MPENLLVDTHVLRFIILLRHLTIFVFLGSGGKSAGAKMDEDSLKILDDLPSSAVELQVKDKVQHLTTHSFQY